MIGKMSGNNNSETILNGTCPYFAYGVDFVEPTPKWKIAIEMWGMAWTIHVYAFGALFALLTLIAIIQTILCCVRPNVPSRMCYIMMNVLVGISGLSRTIVFFLDPYSSKCLLPRPASYFLLHISTPCITSNFGILLGLLLKLSNYQVHGKNLFRPSLVAVFVMFNIMIGVGADLVSAYFTSASLFLTICFAYFIALGLVTTVAYGFVFGRYYSRIVLNRKSLRKMEANDRRMSTTFSSKTPTGVKVTLSACVLFFLICIVNLYYLVAMLRGQYFLERQVQVQDGLVKQSFFKPWYWFIYQTVTKAFDVLLCVLIEFVAGLPLYKKSSKKTTTSPRNSKCY